METEAFIAEILARPAIWKSSHPQHKFKNVVKKLWEEIKQQFLDSDGEYLFLFPDAKTTSTFLEVFF